MKLSGLTTGLLFGVALLVGGLSCIDWSNPEGKPAETPTGPCTITGPASACLACEQTYCCTPVEECAPAFRSQCAELTYCWQGQMTRPEWHDDFTAAVHDCLVNHCQGDCPGGV